MQNTFSTSTSKVLDRVFYNLPAIVLIITILIRVILTVPISIVAIMKFQFFGEIWAYILGIASVTLFETLITTLSVINANFRKQKLVEEANWLLVLIILMVAYNSFLLQSLTQYYEIEYTVSALLTLHVLNLVSIFLMEAVSFVQVKSEISNTQTEISKTETEIKPKTIENFFNETELSELIISLKNKNCTQREIAAKFQISEAKVSRIANKETENIVKP